ncbi:hypothetical protein [Gordonia asplenii]|uniref:hypothetical protein n=1 Tax=Gordonia asplenii TaxID=2725283 RepID=UPI001FE55D21|nr:hypothetical protein [Gordonia asplenii]
MDLPRIGKPLLLTSAAMAALAVFCFAAMGFDHRMLLGVNIWVKPAKFAVAFAMYTFTLAWLLSHPHRGSRWTRRLAVLFAVTAVVDVGFIVLQAARGTFSHFNTQGDPVNSIGQIVFASGVPGLFVANLAIAAILIWQRIGDRATTVAMRIGLIISVVGMGLGYLVGWAGTQVVGDADGHLVELNARHTFGGVDGGPGIPIAGWSSVAGDLRVPHFLGIHGMQILLLAAFALSVLAPRIAVLRDERVRTLLVGVTGGAYSALIAIALSQALRGQSVIHPDRVTLIAYGAVIAGVGAALMWWWPVTADGVRALSEVAGS